VNLQNYRIDKKYAVLTTTSSIGSQLKFKKDNYWYKCDNVGNEGLAEQLVSDMLQFSNINNYLSYERCLINGRKGCRSLSFLQSNEQLITFNNLYKNTHFNSIVEDITKISSFEDRFDFIVDFIKNIAGIDCTQYLYDNIAIDMIIKNPDRHFNNLALIVNKTGNFRCAPVFDNGQGLGQNFTITPPDLTIQEKMERLVANTFCGNFEQQFLIAQNKEIIPLMIDYDNFFAYLNEQYENNIAKEFLLTSLNQYKDIFDEKIIQLTERE
jgi:hypothetical protein